ncbi:MAG: hypothetical protein KC668_07805 [Myxococcales bacterium]|nr:hypothetical protein [Myxococcales bacterium]
MPRPPRVLDALAVTWVTFHLGALSVGCYQHHVVEAESDASVLDDHGTEGPSDGATPDADASAPDASTEDADVPLDAQVRDADVPDAGPRDAAAADVGAQDVGTRDVGTDMGADVDTGPACMPSPEVCGTLVDEDCDGSVDEVVERIACGLGQCVRSAESCDESTPAQCVPLPAGLERCGTGVDEDCDGTIDEVVEQVTCGVGLCVAQGESCDVALPAECTPLPPQEEVCNGLDDDCDGTIDVIDRGADGVPDCLNIVLLGRSGSQVSGTFEQWIRTNGASSRRVLTDAAQVLTAEVIADADIIILDQLQRTYGADEAAVLEAWVRAGGGLMAVTGHYNQPPTVDRANSLLTNLGLAFVFQLPVINSDATRFEDHPAVERVRTVPVIGGFPVVTTSPTALIVGSDTADRALIGVNEVDLGRVYLFADEWVMFDSQWNMLADDLRRFWSSALRWLGQTRSP